MFLFMFKLNFPFELLLQSQESKNLLFKMDPLEVHMKNLLNANRAFQPLTTLAAPFS